MKKKTNINDTTSQVDVKELGDTTSITTLEKMEEPTKCMTEATPFIAQKEEKTAKDEATSEDNEEKNAENEATPTKSVAASEENVNERVETTDAPTGNTDGATMAEEEPADTLTQPTKTVSEETETEASSKPEMAQEELPLSSETLIRQAVEGSAVVAQEEKEKVTAWLTGILSEMDKGQISEKTLKQLVHALHYDRDMAQAGHDGEVRGRNTRIDEWLDQRRGVADIHNLGNAATPSRPSPPLSVIGGLTAADRSTIWERGHEKRVRH